MAQRFPALIALASVALVSVACVDPNAPSDTVQPAEDVPAPQDDTGTPPNPDPYEDEDGDALTRIEEQAGWEIFVDFSGFGLQVAGFLTRSQVTSDPTVADTDGDGLLDGEEFLLKTNPRAVDTDGDGLSDFDEVRRWQTSPVSVDSDADSRDAAAPTSQPPDPALFDGAELQLVVDPLDADRMIPGPWATSPIFRDSDGDGVDDRIERRHAFRNPAIAELPSVHVETVDAVDIRLDVQYADTEGVTYSYGASMATTDTTTSTETVTYTNTSWASATVEAAASASIGIPLGVVVSGGETTTTGMSQAKSVTFDEQSTTTLSQSQSAFFKESVGRTLSTSGGHVTASIRVSNPTPIAYVIDGLGLTLRQAARPGGAPRTLGVLLPQAGFDGFGMAPHSESPAIPFFATFDAQTIIDLMGSADSLIVEPVGFQLRNAEDADFVFVTEEVAAVTGGLLIDDGTGLPDAMRVAAAVDRTDDGAPAGYRLTHALELLGRDWETGVNTVTGRSVLARIDDLSFEAADSEAPDLNDPPYPDGISPGSRSALRFWSVLGASRNQPVDLERDFETLGILPGQELVLAYVSDLDRDGVIDQIETLRGSSASSTNSDATDEAPEGDGLSDFFEMLVGWDVQVQASDPLEEAPAPYRVYPHPARIDSDGDGWDDHAEYQGGTDPNLADTDGDSMPDPTDPEPLKFFNDAPTLTVTPTDLYRLLTLTIAADDDQNNIDVIIVDWGDNTPVDRFEYRAQDVRSDLLFDADHTYAVDGDFTVSVTVVDVFGLSVSESVEVTILAVPEGAVFHWDFDDPDAYGCHNGTTAWDSPAALVDRHDEFGVCFKTGATGQGDPFLGTANPAVDATAFTWSMWVRIEYVGGGKPILAALANYPVLSRISSGPNAGKLNLAFSNVDYFYDSTAIEGLSIWEQVSQNTLPVVPFGSGAPGWHHVVLVMEYPAPLTTQYTLYIDGIGEAPVSFDGFIHNPIQCNLYFAGFDYNWLDFVQGNSVCVPCYCPPYGNDELNVSYDDIRVYDRALTAGEVAALYAE